MKKLLLILTMVLMPTMALGQSLTEQVTILEATIVALDSRIATLESKEGLGFVYARLIALESAPPPVQIEYAAKANNLLIRLLCDANPGVC